MELYRRQTNTFFFQVYSYNLHSTYNNIDARPSSQVLYESLGRSGNADPRSRAMWGLGVVKGAPSLTIQGTTQTASNAQENYTSKTINWFYKTIFMSKISLEAN